MSHPSIRLEGSILSADILDAIERGEKSHQAAKDFGLDPTSKVKDEIADAWAAARAYYAAFQTKISRLREGATGTTETRNLWIGPLLELLAYHPSLAESETVNGKTYRISHRDTTRDGLPIHIIGCNESLNTRSTTPGAPRMSPHGLLQEYINLTEHLYGLLTNGRLLRLLRDSSRLVKLTFIEFDLERIFTEELFADFALLYRLLHASRLPVKQDAVAEAPIEIYHQDSLDSGSRIRDGLSGAVKNVILSLADGFLQHPQNNALRELVAVHPDTLPADLYQHLLRLVYRLLFLMVIEERGLAHPDGTDKRLREIYDQCYSLARLRRLSEKPYFAEARHRDAWLAVQALFRLVDESGTGLKLGVAPLGGDLFDSGSLGPLTHCSLDNATFLGALRQLTLFTNPVTHQLMRVNYGALNVEEFGSVYQGLLEYEPTLTLIDSKWHFGFAKGDERSRTGSHYTPDELVQPLIKHSLDYLIADCLKKPTRDEKVKALLALKVCDVACGSGHILLAAARRIGTELAVLRTGDDQPSPAAFREAVRDVIRHCIYGMDLNPLAVELCKVALWLEAHVPGQALSFLDHHIKCGNAIVGLAHRAELQRGIPDEAFKTLPGDDKDLTAALRKQNKDERKGHRSLTSTVREEADLHALDEAYQAFDQTPERGIADYHTRRDRYEEFRGDHRLRNLRQLADAQVAQFYLPKTPEYRGQHITHDTFIRWMDGQGPTGPGIAAAMTLAQRKRFGHWFIEFWDVVDAGGFDLIIGNPPYLGGQALSGSYGHVFCEWVKWEYAPAGLSELVVYFLRRTYDLLRPGGFMALITTNSIKDGDVRADGLGYLLSGQAKPPGNLVFVTTGTRWPGVANLYVSLFTLHKGTWVSRPRVLDGRPVPFISAMFEDYADAGPAKTLAENEDRIFQGVISLGDGFFLTPDEAEKMVERDATLDEVVLPVINGQELNNRPMQRSDRRIINLFDWSLEKASEFGEAFERVRDVVKPVRQNDNRALYRDRWWQYAEPRRKLTANLGKLDRCFVAAATTKHLNFSALPSKQVFLNTIYVLTTDRWSDYAVVQSTLHEVWARKYSGALKRDLRYSPTDCFATFPFPRDPAHEAALAAIGEAYHEHRRAVMRDLWLGLTDLYNLFHRPDLAPEHVGKVAKESRIPAAEGHARLLRLRDLHRELDQTVLTAYGWHIPSDFGPPLELRHGFYDLDFLPENDRTRYTLHPEARREVLARLLKLNHQRAAAEETKTTAITKPKAQPKQPVMQFPPQDLPLFHPLPAVAATPAARPSLQELVAQFDFSVPNSRRPHIHTTAELFIILLPALVQEADGTLTYADLLAALSFLALPPRDNSSLPPQAASVLTKWRGTFPATLADPNALRAALHDLIVMRHALNIRRDREGYVFFPGIQSAAITHEWTLLDARLALSHAVAVATATPPWRGAVPDADLQAWTTAA